jgi:hypothetical protein
LKRLKGVGKAKARTARRKPAVEKIPRSKTAQGWGRKKIQGNGGMTRWKGMPGEWIPDRTNPE